jgi:hypothetical protein
MVATMSVRLLTGDSLDMLATLDAGSIGACVTDPPYGLKFMGKAWDHGVPGVLYWAAVHRVLKPGAWLLAFGGTRTYHRLTCAIEDAGFEIRDCLSWMYGSGFPKGKGCLKPGWEPIVLARKPAPRPWLNVDGCRLQTTERAAQRDDRNRDGAPDWRMPGGGSGSGATSPLGRWPANVVLDEEAAAMLDAQSGDLQSNSGKPFSRNTDKFRTTYGAFQGSPAEDGFYGDRGGASRFFYCSKASTAERGQGNDHPTVKPLALMDWLVRLVTPPGETGIDPFCGSGSTLLAWDRLGFDCVGIDADPHAIEITQRRLQADAGMFSEVSA